jgi:hypothetical protein
VFPDYEDYRKVLINLKQIEMLSKMTFNFFRIIIENAKIKKEAACPPKRYPCSRKKNTLKDVLNQPICF